MHIKVWETSLGYTIHHFTCVDLISLTTLLSIILGGLLAFLISLLLLNTNMYTYIHTTHLSILNSLLLCAEHTVEEYKLNLLKKKHHCELT